MPKWSPSTRAASTRSSTASASWGPLRAPARGRTDGEPASPGATRCDGGYRGGTGPGCWRWNGPTRHSMPDTGSPTWWRRREGYRSSQSLGPGHGDSYGRRSCRNRSTSPCSCPAGSTSTGRWPKLRRSCPVRTPLVSAPSSRSTPMRTSHVLAQGWSTVWSCSRPCFTPLTLHLSIGARVYFAARGSRKTVPQVTADRSVDCLWHAGSGAERVSVRLAWVPGRSGRIGSAGVDQDISSVDLTRAVLARDWLPQPETGVKGAVLRFASLRDGPAGHP